MSEYVFRTDKPIKSCSECDYRCGLNIIARQDLDARHEHCPLVELPPHRALKDEMYVLNEIDRQFGENEKTSDIAQDIQGIIMSAPTILEASEN